MEFKVNSKEFERLLTKIIPAVPSRTPMQILENFLIEIKDGQLTVFATDLEISLKSSLNIVADSNASFVVPAKLLYDVVRSLGETTLNIKVEEKGKLQLTTDSGEYSLSYLDSSDFPEIPSFPGDTVDQEDLKEISINGEELNTAFLYTSFAMSKEEMRPAMMGTLFEFIEEGLRFVATDGHRLVNMLNTNIKHEITEQYIIPERAISVLHKVLDEKDVKIYLSKSHVSFVLSDIELITRLIGQRYPDYKTVIPMENEFLLHVKTKDLHNAVKRMMLFSTSNTRRVKFSIDGDNLEISAEDLDIGASGKESIHCTYEGDPLTIGFNSAYVNDILSHIRAEEIILKLHSPTKAVIVEPKDNKDNLDLMMLLMPVRLNN
ncbi:MAG: DNA polymerase III subunit beta [Melioribacteraceae bacterium]|nr:DNA polymerase III subunit beta [Melioribacteraceae bacterium]MCF8263096.1 DNA polymerase III subunit beta [Melioribacteraceae bacterium]MCF8413617.1 DNA polymerase III subunit beta [Melioribacteraceae bacterium]MCF8430572.1 DNA polymerase III subunit beta [Melioribacteraceae bacterium]